MKKFFISLSLLLLLSLLISCSPEYLTTLSSEEIAERIEQGLGRDAFRNLDGNAEYFGGALIPGERVESFALRVATDGSNLDEFAVFACHDESAAKELSRRLETYLSALYETNREWYLSYISEEIPKLRDAEVKVFGRYTVYAILSRDGRGRAFDLAREALIK